jgi:hypothetical protein
LIPIAIPFLTALIPFLTALITLFPGDWMTNSPFGVFGYGDGRASSVVEVIIDSPNAEDGEEADTTTALPITNVYGERISWPQGRVQKGLSFVESDYSELEVKFTEISISGGNMLYVNKIVEGSTKNSLII